RPHSPLASHPPAGRAVHAACHRQQRRSAQPRACRVRPPRREVLSWRPTPPPPPPPPLPPPPPPQPLSQAEPVGGRLAARSAFNTLTGVFKNFSGYDLLRLVPTQSTVSQLTYEELFNRITSLFQADGDKISQVLVYGPTSIAVCITDEMESESKYTLHVQPDLADPGRFRVFMRRAGATTALKAANSGCAGVFASLAGTVPLSLRECNFCSFVL
uniref:SPOC domain-containing protein n=1 Tax=Macrostomum lignano TaxID=282301 RepID=A0A1I8FBJ5_9PLAT